MVAYFNFERNPNQYSRYSVIYKQILVLNEAMIVQTKQNLELLIQ